MTTALVQKIKSEIKEELIKEFILPLLENSKDSEGKYKESFIKEMGRVSRSIDKGKGKKFTSINSLKLYLNKL